MNAQLEEVKKLVVDLREEWEKAQKGYMPISDFKTFQEKIETRLDELETKLTRPPVSNKEGVEMSKEMKAFDAWLRKGELTPEEKKVLKIADDTTGGYLAPSEFVGQIISDITEISPIRQHAWVRPTGGKSARVPKKTGTLTAVWAAEAETRNETTGIKFGMEEVPAHTLTALVIVTKEDLEDSYFDLEGYIRNEIAEQIAKGEGTAFVTGNGVGKPEGILTNTNVSSFNSGNASALTADSIVSAPYEIKSGYWKNAAYLMNRSTLKAVRLFKDSNGQYLWQPDYRAGQPGTLNGFPVIETPDMPDVAANAYPVVFGDLKRGYLIVDRVKIEFQRLVELYAATGEIGIIARKRTGGQVVNPSALVKIKVAA